mmetsp:Transcript_32954/g.78207  ORF Transcript_32954/g.78207 Transcript_32954/m.78207 type:complete len:513 (-) Transcript_32954:1762-3300(-)
MPDGRTYFRRWSARSFTRPRSQEMPSSPIREWSAVMCAVPSHAVCAAANLWWLAESALPCLLSRKDESSGGGVWGGALRPGSGFARRWSPATRMKLGMMLPSSSSAACLAILLWGTSPELGSLDGASMRRQNMCQSSRATRPRSSAWALSRTETWLSSSTTARTLLSSKRAIRCSAFARRSSRTLAPRSRRRSTARPSTGSCRSSSSASNLRGTAASPKTAEGGPPPMSARSQRLSAADALALEKMCSPTAFTMTSSKCDVSSRTFSYRCCTWKPASARRPASLRTCSGARTASGAPCRERAADRSEKPRPLGASAPLADPEACWLPSDVCSRSQRSDRSQACWTLSWRSLIICQCLTSWRNVASSFSDIALRSTELRKERLPALSPAARSCSSSCCATTAWARLGGLCPASGPAPGPSAWPMGAGSICAELARLMSNRFACSSFLVSCRMKPFDLEDRVWGAAPSGQKARTPRSCSSIAFTPDLLPGLIMCPMVLAENSCACIRMTLFMSG